MAHALKVAEIVDFFCKEKQMFSFTLKTALKTLILSSNTGIMVNIIVYMVLIYICFDTI